MAIRQYIGARYVPYFVGNWQSNTAYEPLTIVQDSQGNSYTSKKKVPAGIALSNTEYWIMTANVNAQIQQLTDLIESNKAETDADIAAVVQSLATTNTTVTNNKTAADTAIAGVNTRVNNALTAITRLRGLRGVKTIIIGDSYASGTGSESGIGWAGYFTQYSHIDLVAHAYQNAGGFAAKGNNNADYPGKTYADALTEIADGMSADERNSVALVIFQSGWNDCSTGNNPGGDTAVITGLQNAVNAVRNRFINALPVVIPTWNDTHISTGTQFNILYNILGTASRRVYAASTINSITWFYGEPGFAYGDGIHLNQNGYQHLALYIYGFLCGWDGMNCNASQSATNESGVSGSLYCMRLGNTVTIKGTLTVANFSFGTTFATIPATCRPSTAVYLPVMVYGGTRHIAMAQVDAAGSFNLRDLGQSMASTSNIPIYVNLTYEINLPR